MPDFGFTDMREALTAFERGYIGRDLNGVDNFVNTLFAEGEDISIVGTSTGELVFGRADVKQMIYDDWEGWGDLLVDTGGARYEQCGGYGFFIANGSVKHSFKHTPERYEGYVNFINDIAKDDTLSPEQRLAFINWALALTYHQREDTTREYRWPLKLSGVMVKRAGGWKIAHLHFGIERALYPDERFEYGKACPEDFGEQTRALNEHAQKASGASAAKLKEMFAEAVERGEMGAMEGAISLDMDSVLEYRMRGATYYIAVGVNEYTISGEALAKRALDDILRVTSSELSARDKLFMFHRSAAYAIKEAASGERFTCPVRLTALLPESGAPKYHMSYPFTWIFEGKLDGV